MWRAYARCRAARAKLSAPCTRVARATCCGFRRVRTPQRSRGHSASARRHPASAGRARGEGGGGPGRARGECGGRRGEGGGTTSPSRARFTSRSFMRADPCASVRSAQRQRKLVTSACRTAIACALICQKRLKRDELMRIHQSDTISVGAGTVHEQGVNRSLNSGSGYFLEALDVCPVPTSGTGVYGARGSLNWPHRPEYRLVIQVDGVVRVSGDLARGMVLRAQIVRKCNPLSTNSFAPIRG